MWNGLTGLVLNLVSDTGHPPSRVKFLPCRHFTLFCTFWSNVSRFLAIAGSITNQSIGKYKKKNQWQKKSSSPPNYVVLPKFSVWSFSAAQRNLIHMNKNPARRVVAGLRVNTSYLARGRISRDNSVKRVNPSLCKQGLKTFINCKWFTL